MMQPITLHAALILSTCDKAFTPVDEHTMIVAEYRNKRTRTVQFFIVRNGEASRCQEVPDVSEKRWYPMDYLHVEVLLEEKEGK